MRMVVCGAVFMRCRGQRGGPPKRSSRSDSDGYVRADGALLRPVRALHTGLVPQAVTESLRFCRNREAR